MRRGSRKVVVFKPDGSTVVADDAEKASKMSDVAKSGVYRLIRNGKQSQAGYSFDYLFEEEHDGK